MKRIRLSMGLAVKYAAAAMGVSECILRRMENGTTALTYKRAVQACRLYNCDLGAFDDALGGPLRPVVPPAIR